MAIKETYHMISSDDVNNRDFDEIFQELNLL